MRIIARKALRDYGEQQPSARDQLGAWYAEARHAEWATPADVKAKYGNASILKEGRVVFNICGNEYRLVVWINCVMCPPVDSARRESCQATPRDANHAEDAHGKRRDSERDARALHNARQDVTRIRVSAERVCSRWG